MRVPLGARAAGGLKVPDHGLLDFKDAPKTRPQDAAELLAEVVPGTYVRSARRQ